MCDLLLQALPDRQVAALGLAASLSAWPAAISPLCTAGAPAAASAVAEGTQQAAGAAARTQGIAEGEPGAVSQPPYQPGQQYGELRSVLHAITCDLAAGDEVAGQGSPETAAACSSSTQGAGPGQLVGQARACLLSAVGRDELVSLPGTAPWRHVAHAAGNLLPSPICLSVPSFLSSLGLGFPEHKCQHDCTQMLMPRHMWQSCSPAVLGYALLSSSAAASVGCTSISQHGPGGLSACNQLPSVTLQACSRALGPMC